MIFPESYRERFQVIYADPPWQFKSWSHRGEGKGASQHYSCMSLDNLLQLPVANIAQPNAALFLWVVQPMLPEAMRLITAWGFTYKTVAFSWVKMPQQWTWADGRIEPRLGLGYYTRSGMEQCWLAIRGNGFPRPPSGPRRSVAQVLHAPMRQHSRKPDEIAARIEKLTASDSKIELFARAPRAGWEVWGNETEKFDTP